LVFLGGDKIKNTSEALENEKSVVEGKIEDIGTEKRVEEKDTGSEIAILKCQMEEIDKELEELQRKKESYEVEYDLWKWVFLSDKVFIMPKE